MYETKDDDSLFTGLVAGGAASTLLLVIVMYAGNFNPDSVLGGAGQTDPQYWSHLHPQAL